MTLGERIRNCRLEKKLTQDAVARALGLSRQAVTKWENGSAAPSTENLIRLTELFEVPLETLIGHETTTSPDQTIPQKKQGDSTLRNLLDPFKFQIITAAAFLCIWGTCRILFHLFGIPSLLWRWLNLYHILPITCLFSVCAATLKRRWISGSLVIGSIAALIVGELLGMHEHIHSATGRHNGWVYYLATLFTFCLLGIAITLFKKERAKRTLLHYVFYIALIITAVISASRAADHIRYNTGAEAGYRHGYQIGSVDAAGGQVHFGQFSETYIPKEYEPFSAEYKGFALYWGSGYEDGYNETLSHFP